MEYQQSCIFAAALNEALGITYGQQQPFQGPSSSFYPPPMLQPNFVQDPLPVASDNRGPPEEGQFALEHLSPVSRDPQESPESPVPDGPTEEMPQMPADPAGREKKQHVELFLDKKKEILDKLGDGEFSYRQLAKQYDVSATTVRNIARSRQKIIEFWNGSQDASSLKRVRRSPNEELNEKVLDFVGRCRASGIHVTGPLIQTAAKSLAAKLNIAFSASNGWLECFRRKYGIQFQRMKRKDYIIELSNMGSVADDILAEVIESCDLPPALPPGQLPSDEPLYHEAADPGPGGNFHSRPVASSSPDVDDERQIPSYEEALQALARLKSYAFAQEDLDLVQQVFKLEADITSKHMAKMNPPSSSSSTNKRKSRKATKVVKQDESF